MEERSKPNVNRGRPFNDFIVPARKVNRPVSVGRPTVAPSPPVRPVDNHPHPRSHTANAKNLPPKVQHKVFDVEPKKRFGKRTRLLLTVVISLLLLTMCGVIVVKVGPHAVNKIKSITTHKQKINSIIFSPEEAELPADSLATYKTAPDMPRRLAIPALKLNSRIVPVDLASDKHLRPPGSIYDTGWYQKTSKPGEAGVSVIDGYIVGPTKPGIFYNIYQLAKNDPITIERGDGTLLTYKVSRIQLYEPGQSVDMTSAAVPAEASKPCLNIIAYSNADPAKDKTHSQHVVLFAVQQ